MDAGSGLSDLNPETIPRDRIRAQLGHILASRAFDASRRNRAFLRFIVEESLAGRADRIKAYTIATSVLGRDEAFDPQADPIVRIEASRLRRSLERYYLIAGQDDPVRIDIPKGGYVPSFQRLQSVHDDCAFPHDAYAPEPPDEEPPVLPEHHRGVDGTRRDLQSADVAAPPCSGRLGSRGVRHGGRRARDWPLGLGRRRLNRRPSSRRRPAAVLRSSCCRSRTLAVSPRRPTWPGASRRKSLPVWRSSRSSSSMRARPAPATAPPLAIRNFIASLESDTSSKAALERPTGRIRVTARLSRRHDRGPVVGVRLRGRRKWSGSLPSSKRHRPACGNRGRAAVRHHCDSGHAAHAG